MNKRKQGTDSYIPNYGSTFDKNSISRRYDHSTGHRKREESSRRKDFASRDGLSSDDDSLDQRNKRRKVDDPREKYADSLAKTEQRKTDYLKAWYDIHETSESTEEIHQRLAALNKFSATDLPDLFGDMAKQTPAYNRRYESGERVPKDYVTRGARKKNLHTYRFGGDYSSGDEDGKSPDKIDE